MHTYKLMTEEEVECLRAVPQGRNFLTEIRQRSSSGWRSRMLQDAGLVGFGAELVLAPVKVLDEGGPSELLLICNQVRPGRIKRARAFLVGYLWGLGINLGLER